MEATATLIVKIRNGGPSETTDPLRKILYFRFAGGDNDKALLDFMNTEDEPGYDNLNTLNAEGETPVTVAIKRKNETAINFFLKNSADVTLKGESGMSAVEAAAALQPENVELNRRVRTLARLPEAEDPVGPGGRRRRKRRGEARRTKRRPTRRTRRARSTRRV